MIRGTYANVANGAELADAAMDAIADAAMDAEQMDTTNIAYVMSTIHTGIKFTDPIYKSSHSHQ